jgi:ubiquinone/menaquinone biosynthesis C-methylase UbiE
MKWFLRKSTSEALAVSMAGIKLGDRLLVVGCSDPLLIAQLAVKTGLTGRAFAVDEDDARVSKAVDVAAREGALVETAKASWTALPIEDEGFDVAVVRDVLPYLARHRRAACIDEVRRVLRPGGRCLVVDGQARTGIASMIAAGSSPRGYDEGGPVEAFTNQGFKAARIVAERDGLVFAEAVKAAL